MTKLNEVARAISDALGLELYPHMFEPEDVLRAARAAIAEMRDPTSKMLREGDRVTTDGRGAEDIWPVMIDEALR